MIRTRDIRIGIGISLTAVLVIAGSMPALGIKSPNYTIDEDFVGGGGVVDSSSSNYSARDSAGASAAGNSKSGNYTSQSGATTTGDPMLEFTVSSSNVALGSLMTSLTRTGTTSFSVRNYTSHGYVVQAIGTPPSNGSHALANMATATAPTPGVEQFGINLVANTVPVAFGANPLQVPSADFSSGEAASGYNTPNTYRYNSGDVIASAPESSGRTDYTISYVANSSNATPGGSYTGTQVLVCTGTY